MIQPYSRYIHSPDLAFHNHPFINCLKAFKATQQAGNMTLILYVPRVQNSKNAIFKKLTLIPEQIGHFFPEFFNANYLVQNPKSALRPSQCFDCNEVQHLIDRYVTV